MRCKGIFVDAKSKKAFGLQGVEDLFEFREISNPSEPVSILAPTFLFVAKGNLEAEKVKEEIMSKCSERFTS